MLLHKKITLFFAGNSQKMRIIVSNSDTNLCSVMKYQDSINKFKVGARNVEALCFRPAMKVSAEMVFHNVVC